MALNSSERTSGTGLKGLDIVLAAIWLGLLSGLIEGVFMVVRKGVFHAETAMGPNIVWMAPIADVAWLLIPGILLGLLVMAWRSRFSATLAVFALTFGAAICVTFLAILDLHTYALLVIAIGIAVQSTRAIMAHPQGFVRLVRRTIPVLAGLTALAALSVIGGARIHERRAVSRLPAAAKGSPNILLLVLDTARALSMSLDGYDRPSTPALQRFAATGINFREARSPSSWTLPSHASMFTGQLPHRLSTGFRTALDGTFPTLAEELTSQGYVTAGFVANLHYTSREFGLNRGFIHYSDYGISASEIFLNSSIGRYLAIKDQFRTLIGYQDIIARKNAENIDGSLVSWLSRQHDGKPTFAFVNYYDAHEPYFPPPEWDRKFASSTPRKPYLTDQSIRGGRRVDKLKMKPAEIDREHDAYVASLAYLDDQIGHLLDSLKEKGLLDNTLVIITSDHGEQFGEHGLFVHNNSLYSPVMKVPLIISYPLHVPANQENHERLNLADLPATILDLAGLTPHHSFPGTSLRRHWDSTMTRGSAEEPLMFEVITSGIPSGKAEELRSLILGDDEYFRHEDGSEEVYNLAADPSEATNLADSAGFAPRFAVLRQAMDSILQATGPDAWGR
ncbi:MAG: sulfatase [Gemmatimonadota bacterium]